MTERKQRILVAAAILLVGLAGVAILAAVSGTAAKKTINPIIGSGHMKITSPQFEQDGAIPARYTCDGENINPPLRVSGVPEEARTLALIVDDPDAAAGAWTHWTVWNIPAADIVEIGEKSVPGGAVEGLTDFGRAGYGGPCPPSGEHRYFFQAYALDAELELTAAAGVKELEAAMRDHILDKAGLIGVYRRQP
ncbi:MAG: YbhB/YbcL family Raf kinase inhibitor-like protein [Patescibacteria group bacterium]|jgi:hypothetical protein